MGRYLGFWLGNKKRGNNFQRGGPVKEKTMVVSGYGLTFGLLWHFVTKCDILLQNAIALLLKNVKKVYCKMYQVFYYKMRQCYYKMQQFLENGTVLL